MSASTKNKNGQRPDGSDVDEHEDDDRPVSGPAGRQGGFFTIYKKGQGYWTRMGTAIGVALLVTVTAVFAYTTASDFYPANKTVPAAITGSVVLLGVVLGWRYMNKPNAVDFLIATDVEMKKVNWTSRQELFGSTRIVIIFMFLTALILFGIDVLTGFVFQIIGLLKFGPLS